MQLTFLEIFGDVIRKLDSESIGYMIVGSIASMLYGEPRLTKDMDVVVEVSAAHTTSFLKLFGDDEGYYLPPMEILGQEFVNKGQFNIIHTTSGLKVDVIVKKASEHALAEFKRRQKINLLPNLDVWVASPEDVIIKKLVYYLEGRSEKHISDMKGIMAHTEVDRAYVEGWVERLNLTDAWIKL